MNLSVIMPVYNAGRYIKSSILSVLGQTFKDFEFIILNDGSTDNSLSIIQEFDDPRIIVIDQPNIGLAKTLNKGLNIAKGQYIARMDADDICYKERFEVQLRYLQSNPNIKLLGSAVEIIDIENNSVCIDVPYCGEKFIKEFLLKIGNPFKHPTVIVDRNVLLEFNGYNEDIGKYFEDYFLWAQISKKYDVDILKQVLLKYRITPGSIMSSAKSPAFSEFMLKTVNAGIFTSTDKEKMNSLKQINNEVPDHSMENYFNRIEKTKALKLNVLYAFLSKNFNSTLAMNVCVALKRMNLALRG